MTISDLIAAILGNRIRITDHADSEAVADGLLPMGCCRWAVI